MFRLVFVGLLLAAVLSMPASAAKPFGSISGPLDPATHQPVAASFGDTVTFDVTGPSQWLWLTVKCWQGDTVVLTAWTGYWDGYFDPAHLIVLGPTGRWQSGAADCEARLYEMDGGEVNYRRPLAVLTFGVAS